MNVLELDVQTEAKGGGQWRLYPIGDLHIDAAATDLGRIRKYLDFIRQDPFSCYVIVGDLVDGTVPPHRFFEARAVRPDVLANMDEYVAYVQQELEALLQPLAGKPGILIQGNHDRRSHGTLWSGLAWSIANKLPGCQYGGDEAIVRVSAPRVGAKGNAVYRLHAHHGAGGGMYPGGKINRYQQTVGQLADADIYVRGHVHDSDARIIPVYSCTKRGTPARLVARQRAFITTPAFWPNRTEGQNNYASRRGYPPGDEGILYLNVECPQPNGHDGKMWRAEFPI